MKKLLIILGTIVLILAGIFFAVFLRNGTNIERTPGEAGERTGFLSFFPFGRGDTTSRETPRANENNNQNEGEEIPATPAPIPRLRQLSSTPIAGAGIIAPTATSTLVRFMERATGNIFEVATTTDIERLTNTTIPKVYHAEWGNNLNSVLIQILADDNETIDAFNLSLVRTASIGTTTASTTPGVTYRLQSRSIGRGVPEIETSPAGTRYAYIENSGRIQTGLFSSSQVATLNVPGSLRDIHIDVSDAGRVYVTTNPSAASNGFAYELIGTTLNRIAGNLRGLDVLPHKNSVYAFLSVVENRSMRTYMLNRETGSMSSIPLRTFAEKCVWAEKSLTVYCAVPKALPQGDYPDTWYQGEIALSDEIWSINAETLEVTRITDITSESQNKPLDIIELHIDPNDRQLIFTDKRELMLWALDLISPEASS